MEEKLSLLFIPYWKIIPYILIEISDVICEEYEFKCNNHKCIHSSLKCDGKDDCGENSDETEDCHGNSFILKTDY